MRLVDGTPHARRSTAIMEGIWRLTCARLRTEHCPLHWLRLRQRMPTTDANPLKRNGHGMQLCRGCMDEYLAWSQSHACTRKPSLPYATALAIARKSSTPAIIPAFRGGVWRARRNTTKDCARHYVPDHQLSMYMQSIDCTAVQLDDLPGVGSFLLAAMLTRYENTAAPAGVAMTEPQRATPIAL